jgi:hypothetical protein
MLAEAFHSTFFIQQKPINNCFKPRTSGSLLQKGVNLVGNAAATSVIDFAT